MLAFVKMIFRVRLYGVSRHEDGAKRNPNGQCGGESWEALQIVDNRESYDKFDNSKTKVESDTIKFMNKWRRKRNFDEDAIVGEPIYCEYCYNKLFR